MLSIHGVRGQGESLVGGGCAILSLWTSLTGNGRPAAVRTGGRGIRRERTSVLVQRDRADAAFALMRLGDVTGFIGIVMMLLSFFLAGTAAYFKKSGTPALMGLLGILGLAGVVMSFIPGMGFLVFMAIFPLSLLLLAFIGIQQARA